MPHSIFSKIWNNTHLLMTTHFNVTMIPISKTLLHADNFTWLWIFATHHQPQSHASTSQTIHLWNYFNNKLIVIHIHTQPSAESTEHTNIHTWENKLFVRVNKAPEINSKLHRNEFTANIIHQIKQFKSNGN